MTQVILTSSVLILVMALARLVLRKRVSQRLIYGLWLLVALRLLIPVQFGQSRYSVTTVAQPATQQVQQVVSRPISGPSREEVYDRLVEDYLAQTPQLPDSPEMPVTPTAPEVTVPAPTVPEKVQTQLRQEAEEQVTAPSLGEVLTGLWIAGVVAMGVWFLTANLLFLRKIRRDSTVIARSEGKRQSPETTENLGGLPRQCAHWLAMTGKLRLRLCPHLDTPCLVGLFRPTVCLTPVSLGDEDVLRHVLTHETTHLRHGDHIWSAVRCLCLCIYWFNPLVWLAAILSKRDQELACDEAALQKLGEDDRIPYGKTLLTIVSHSVTPGKILQTATSMSETKKQLKERIEFIVKRPQNLWFAAISLILIAALTAGCVFTGSKLSNQPTTPSTEATTPTTPTEPSIELPDTYYYNDILLDYQKLIDFRLSDTFETDWENGVYIEESTSLSVARSDEYHDRNSLNGTLEKKWDDMLLHMTDGLENATTDSFGYVARDITGDAMPELFWIRENWTLLAVFTVLEDYAVLLDAFSTEYQGLIADDGTVYTRFDARGDVDYEIRTISAYGTLNCKYRFGAINYLEDNPSYYYEDLEKDYYTSSQIMYQEALDAHPFQWGESWAGITLESAADYEPVDIEIPPAPTDSLVYLPVEAIKYQEDGTTYRAVYGYEHRGLITSVEFYNGSGELVEASYYTYNDKGLLEKEIWQHGTTERVTEYSYTFNKNGSVTNVARQVYGMESYSLKYLYRGDDGRLLKVEYWWDGQVTNSYVLSYDVKGRDNLTNVVYTPHTSSNPEWDQRRVILYYDEENRISNGLKFNHKNEIIEKETNGLIYSYVGSTLVDLRSSSSRDTTYTYELNEHGKVIRRNYNGERNSSYTTFRYEAFSVDESLCKKMLPWDDAMVIRGDMDILDFYQDPVWLWLPRPWDVSYSYLRF